MDHNATTPLDPEVRETMCACLSGEAGNPSSLHAWGQAARRTIDRARLQVAALVAAPPETIVFTGGGTEADNLAILGVSGTSKHPRIVTTAIEHQAVLNPCRHVANTGGAAGFVPVEPDGRVDPARVLAAVRDDTTLVSVMLANNDVGTIQPVEDLAPALRARGVPLHADAVQAAGRIPVDVAALGVDLLSFSAHKFHGPQGVGALFVRPGTPLAPIVFGGRQERGLRPGTENVAAIAGFGKACELAAARLAADASRIQSLRDRFEARVLASIHGTAVHGASAPRLPNTTNLAFAGIDGEMLVIHLDLLGLAASTGSACTAADGSASHVLTAMGVSPQVARSSVRFSFGRGHDEAAVDEAVDIIARAVALMRGEAV
jgi:cysteine desulfurase